MKKWRFVLLSVIIVVMMSGCSHKSNAELVDVEQFRCQDSIETVFDVWGEVSLDKKYGEYTYENLNLFGYEGTTYFLVRTDDNTIKYFSCWLRLNDNEYEDVVSYFSEKYGDYEEGYSYLEGKTYSWIISEEDGEIGYTSDEIGYDSISIRATDTRQLYVIKFEDEWSSVSDSEYFEALEESQNPESDRETVESKEYEYDGATMYLTFSKDEDGLFYFSITLDVEEKWKGAGIYTYVASLVKILNEQLEDKGISSTVVMLYDEAVISNIMSYTTDGELINVGTWLIEGYQDENFDADECEKLWEQMEDDIYYFLMGDEYLQYKNN